MAGLSLLTLLDDIASVLDDVAVMTKVAARKTAGVLGDDLALNAQQVSGVRAEREIPVVWAVAKGSFRNKLILVPAALLISAIAPWLITPMLVVGGLYLCFEGAEKIAEKWFHSQPDDQVPISQVDSQRVEQQEDIDVADFERKKIAGAIRTDFILSAEIIVIALGTVQGQVFLTQLAVVSLIAIVMTIGVYGLVAGIVKLDDAGFYLVANSKTGSFKNTFGQGLVQLAPHLMRALGVIGTIAMFLVGGGIIMHSIPQSHDWLHTLISMLPDSTLITVLLSSVVNGMVGVLSGILVLLIVDLAKKLRS
ncbi:DUF808 domain-containing protein [Photobacterium sanguinicancri]|uniref:DUF808 domain-containing protein n=1 Tax=Photobacterium sanguinicancri TaxID=875932 RepID=UPI000787687D|nr:DUF808 domain-containing protein [Photobacterium sanguinicancri]KXI23368.1 hypothetical protein AS132_08260 [Photobacterium sanguinicancri]